MPGDGLVRPDWAPPARAARLPDEPPRCARCQGMRFLSHGLVLDGSGRFQRDRPYPCPACYEPAFRAEVRAAWGLGPEVADYTFASFAAEEVLGPGNRAAYQQAQRFVERRPASWLVLTGPRGTGKTGLAAAVVHAVLDATDAGDLLDASSHRTPLAAFVHVGDLLSDLRDAIGQNRRETQMRWLQAVPLLVIDDLGGEQPQTDWTEGQLIELLQGRRSMATVLTTNLEPSAFRNPYFVTRFADAQRCQVVRVTP